MTSSLPTAAGGALRPRVRRPIFGSLRPAAAVGAFAALIAVVALPAHAENGATAAPSAESDAQVAGVVQRCAVCHGLGGRSISPDFPRLAGQQAGYLRAQLTAFRDRRRPDPPHAAVGMAVMAAGLDDAMIGRLAAYYAAQDPSRGAAQAPVPVAAGQELYLHGVPDRVLPCLACHGAGAEGTDTTPRLAGQERLYLQRQLAAFAADTRPDGLMHLESTNMTARQIADVSAYLASLSEAKAAPVAGKGPVMEAQVASLVQVCSSCHEFGGSGAPPGLTFPRLAGQQAGYLRAQLTAFRDGTRRDPPHAVIAMAPTAADLDDAMIERLATHYAAQGAGSDFAAGRTIYERGIRDRIPPCMTCHGMSAEGIGKAPRLAGQDRLYLQRQLAYFATNPQADGTMHQEAMTLTERQISDISAYLASR